MSGDQRKKDKSALRTPLNNTAVQVLKGAVVKVLGAQCAITATVEFSSTSRGILTVTYPGDTVPPEQLKAIEKAAASIIAANVPVQVLTLDRAAAEAKYTAAPVNSQYIYDKEPVAEDVKELSIVEIADWSVNCAPGPYLKSTGEVKGVIVQKQKRRANQQLLELWYAAGDAAAKDADEATPTPAPAAAAAAAAPATGGKKAGKKGAAPAAAESKQDVNSVFANWQPGNPSLVQATTTEILDSILAPVLKARCGVTLDGVATTELRSGVENALVMMQNLAYARGMSAKAAAVGQPLSFQF